MKVNVQIRKASFGKGYNLYVAGEYQSYHETIEDAEWEGKWVAYQMLGINDVVVKEFEVDGDEV